MSWRVITDGAEWARIVIGIADRPAKRTTYMRYFFTADGHQAVAYDDGSFESVVVCAVPGSRKKSGERT